MQDILPLADFKNRVFQRSYVVPVIVEISMNYCGSCLWMEKVLSDIVSFYTGQIDFVSVYLEDCPMLSAELDLSMNPTILYYCKGQEKARFSGALPAYAVELWVEKNFKIYPV